MQLNLSLLNIFLEEIVSYHDFKEVKNKNILEICKLVDHEESFWHVEDNKIWKKKIWLKEESRRESIRKELENLKQIKDSRMSAWKELQIKLAEAVGTEMELVKDLALKTMKNKSGLAKLLGVDLTLVPDMPEKYTLIEGNKTYEI